jgi:hypothetical protein
MPPIYVPIEPPPVIGGGPILPPILWPPVPPDVGLPPGKAGVLVLVYYNDKWHPHWYVVDTKPPDGGKPPEAGPKR